MSESGIGKKRNIEESNLIPMNEHKTQVVEQTPTPSLHTIIENRKEQVTNTLLPEKKELTITKAAELNNTKIIEQEMVSADSDIKKTVTSTSDLVKPTGEDASITSEQLLMALTSVPTTETGENKKQGDKLPPVSPLKKPTTLHKHTFINPSFKLNKTENNLPSAPNISVSNLPDIKAALRRLSSADPSRSERKPSSEDILGNALAAVAASAIQSKSSPQIITNQNIGHLAANISNLLSSTGMRNSFSQEDTQKLAAAIRKNSTTDSRRKSTIVHPFMIDQTPKKPRLIVKNDLVWKSVEGIAEKFYGYYLYSPHLILPHLESCVNGLLEIRIPAQFLTFDNQKVKKRAIWGTEIYTDDSDIVAMIIHSGKYQLPFIEPKMDVNDPFILAISGKQKESIETYKKILSSNKGGSNRCEIPDHDLKVTIRVLPKLQFYSSSIQHKLKSREWHKHDGMSLYIQQVEKIQKGEATVKGRCTLKSNMFIFENYRKKALGLKKEISTQNIPTQQKGRIKKSHRVMRMFQIKSELKKNQ